MRKITAESIGDVLRAAGVEHFWEGIDVFLSRKDGVSPVVALYVRYHNVTFDELSAISEALGTRHINLDNRVREGGYCDTCRYSYSITVITVTGARLPDIQTEEA